MFRWFHLPYDPGIDAVGFVHVRVCFPELVDELRVDREHLGLSLLKRSILKKKIQNILYEE